MSDTVDSAEYLTTTRIGEKGQITIPKEYRDGLGLESGSPIAVIRVGKILLLLTEQERFKELCERIAEVFPEQGISEADLLGGISTIIANQEIIIGNQMTIISNEETIIGNQKTIIANQETIKAK
jgi:AbrB family looped-hinge helix DNA binding protein